MKFLFTITLSLLGIILGAIQFVSLMGTSISITNIVLFFNSFFIVGSMSALGMMIDLYRFEEKKNEQED